MNLPKIPQSALLLVTLLLAGVSHAQKAVPVPTAQDKPILTAPTGKYLLVVPVTIAGKSYNFMLDTGSGYTIIDNRVAKEISKTMPDSQVPPRLLQGLSDGVSITQGTLKKRDFTLWQPQPFAIGTETLYSPLPWLGLDLSKFTQSTGVRIDGLLGVDTFRRLNWQVDNKNRTLTVSVQPPSTLSYQQCVPYNDNYGSAPELRIDIDNRNWVPFHVDTGTDLTLAPADLLQVLRDQGASVTPLGQSVSTSAGGIRVADDYLVDNLAFNGQPLGKLKIRESGLNNLGMGFMSRFNRYLFIPSEMVFCYDPGDLAQHDQQPQRYIGLAYLNQRIEIAYSNPADLAEFGLHNGDVLLKINGQPVQAAQLEEIREQIANAPAGSLTLDIERRGKQKTITL